MIFLTLISHSDIAYHVMMTTDLSHDVIYSNLAALYPLSFSLYFYSHNLALQITGLDSSAEVAMSCNPNNIEWMHSVLHMCVYSDREAASVLFGLSSVCCWLFAQMRM